MFLAMYFNYIYYTYHRMTSIMAQVLYFRKGPLSNSIRDITFVVVFMNSFSKKL